MPTQEDYRVTLEAFQGPLDLLLFLIRRAEVDVHDIPVAAITEQYLSFLHQLDDIDVDLAGEFLVMAATLIEIKSRTLMPETATEEGDDDGSGGMPGGGENRDPRDELVRQLLAYQRFRIASEELEDRRREFAGRFPLRPCRRDLHRDEDEAPPPVELELDDVHIMDLAEACEALISSIDFGRLGDHVIEMDDTPIELHQTDLLDRLEHTTTHRLRLQEVFRGRERQQRIGLFLATLELVRLRRVTVIQDDIDSDIELILLDEGEDAAPFGAPESSVAGTPAKHD